MPNLLTRTPLAAPQELAELYVVWDRKDYRMTLATLLSLVTKEKLGLGNVENTADADKAISTATQVELAKKADAISVPTKEAFDALAGQLQDFVSIDTLNTAVDAIVNRLNDYTTKVETNQAVSAALSPITLALSNIQSSIQAQEQAIQSLQTAQANNITLTQLNEGLSHQADAFNQGLNTLAQATSAQITAIGNQLTAFQTVLTSFELLLNDKADRVHRHAIDDIDGLRQYIEEIALMVEPEVTANGHEW